MGMFDYFATPEYRHPFYLGVCGGPCGCSYIPAIFSVTESSICGHFLPSALAHLVFWT